MFGRKTLDDLRKLYLDELKDLYDAEHQILDALPKLENAAENHELKDAFAEHFEETKGHVRRLEQVFRGLGEEPERKTCEGIKGLIKEGDEFVKARGDGDTIDAALISAAQRVEHYEIAAYGTLRTYARHLGHQDQVRLLEETLDEESDADEKLTEIAESGINEMAAVGA